jgi:hypothetical protein
VYVEHSFVRWKSSLRGEDAANDGASALALGLVGISRPSAHATAANVPAQRDPTTTRLIVRRIANFIAHSFGGR